MTMPRAPRAMNEITPEDVIKVLKKNMQKARRLAYVVKPMAWALYRTWRAIDGVEQPRERRRAERVEDCRAERILGPDEWD